MVKKPEKKKDGNLKGAKNTVGEKAEQNHRLFNNMAEGYAHCRMIYENGQAQDWVYISVNKSFERLTGLKEVGGKHATEVMPDIRETYPGLFETCSRVSQTGQPEKIELFVESLQTWFSVSVFSPEKEFFAAIFDVITERKEVEAKLHESRERFRTVANFTYDWEYWLDDNRQILYTSPSCERITGYNIGKFEQDSSLLEKIIHPDDRPLYKRHIQEEIEKAEPISLDFRIITTSGNIRWISHACQRVYGTDGHPMGRRASNRDITQRRQAEQALRENEATLNMAEQVAQMGSWRLDMRTKKVTWSEQMFRLFGVERKDFDGDMDRVVAERVHPDDVSSALEFNRSILGGISSIASLTYRIVLPTGTERTVRTHGKLIRDETGRPTSMTGYVQDITEWVRTELALRQSEERFQMLFDKAPLGYQSLDADGRFIDINRAWLDTLGYTREEVLGKWFGGFLSPEYVEMFRERFPIFKAAGQIHSEFEMLHKNGTRHWIAFDGRVGYALNGDFKQTHCILQDITERKRAEEALRESEEKMSSIFRVAPTGIGVVRDRVLLDVNPRICEMTGYTKEELVGQNARMLYPTQENFDFVGSEKYRQIAQKGTGQVETLWQKKDGSIIDVLLASTPIDLADLSKGVTFTALDITERKRAEDALRQSEDKFKYVFDNSTVAKSITSTDGRFHVNQAFCELVGYSEKELDDKPWREITHPDDVDLNLREVDEILAGKKETARFIKRYIHKNGSVVWVDLSTSLRRDTDGNPLYFLTTALDITERKHAEEALRQSEERFELAMLAVNDGIWDWNIAEDRLYFDPRYYTLAGYEPNEFPHTFEEWRNRIHPDDVEHCIREVNAHLAGQTKVFDIEFRFLRKDGTWMWIRGRGKSVRHDANGKVSRMIGTHTDITDRKLAEESIRQSERQMKALLTSLDDIVFEFDQDGTYLNIWTADESLLAQPKAEMLGKRVLEVMGRERGAQFSDAVKRVSAGGDPESIEYPLDVMDGWRWFMARISPILTQEHTVSVLVRDITERKRVEEQVQVQLQRMRALNEIDRAISSSMDLHLSLDILLNEVLSQLEVDAASVLLLDPTSQMLEYVAGKGYRSLAIRESRVLLGQGFAGRAGLERKTLHVPNLKATGTQFLRGELLKDEKFVEYFGVPLIAKGLLKGVLEIFHRSPLDPNLEWVNYLETLGGQAAIAIDNAQLFDGVQRSNLELIAAYDATIEGWSQAMDLRDKETEGHTLRVTEWTVKLAKKMKLSPQEITHMRRGALLHDIGKLGIPDHILHKAAALDRLEWAIMRQHPVYAFNMLQPISYLRPALDIPYCHHEKWDGSGYPRGLKGEAIPLSARIFAIVDVWDALRSDRPYRKGWAIEKIHEYLIAESGKHFDPQVVKTFMPIIEEEE